jgi:hypothetical protein
MARSFYHLSILVLVSILLRPSPLPSKLFCLLELTQPAEFGGEVMCTAVLWPYVCQRMSDFFLEQLRLENLVACKWKMLNISGLKEQWLIKSNEVGFLKMTFTSLTGFKR